MDTSYKRAEIKKFLNDTLKDYGKEEVKKLIRDAELHNQIFNTDYYLVYDPSCKDWLGDKAFDVVATIKEYDEDNFGEVTTELTEPEKVVNMYVYIVGEDLINEDPRFERD